MCLPTRDILTRPALLDPPYVAFEAGWIRAHDASLSNHVRTLQHGWVTVDCAWQGITTCAVSEDPEESWPSS